jgi:hypothetical protein
MGTMRRLLGGGNRTIGGYVYGTIVVLAALEAGVAERQHPRTLAVVVAATSFVIWTAHVYSHGLGESLERGRRLDWREFSDIARREYPILAAAFLPTAALLLGAFGVLSESTAIWLAFGLGAAALVVQGARYARVERLGPVGTVLVLAANLALALMLVLLKSLVAH